MASAALGYPLHQCSPRKLAVVSGDRRGGVGGDIGGGFPSFLPKEVHNIKDPYARSLAQRIQRLPVKVDFTDKCIMSSCVAPMVRGDDENPLVLLHCFDSSCLEWRTVYPLLEDNGLETWAVDILGWGFSDLEERPPCDVASKRFHLYKLWKSHIKRPMTLVGPSLGAAVAIDFAVHYPEAVNKLILINPSVYSDRKGFKRIPKSMAYAMASLLKSMPVRWFAKTLVFDGITWPRILDLTNVGRLHCLLPWWEDSTVSFMLSGGYNVRGLVEKVKQNTLIICSERDKIGDVKLAERLVKEMGDASMVKIGGSGHMPHVDKPNTVTELISEFAAGNKITVQERSFITEADMMLNGNFGKKKKKSYKMEKNVHSFSVHAIYLSICMSMYLFFN